MTRLQELWERLILSVKPPRVVTIIGSGGKTSLMYNLQARLAAAGLAAVATATTKLSRRSPYGYTYIQSLADGCAALDSSREPRQPIALVAGGVPGDPDKVAGLPPDWIDNLAERYIDRVFLVEGDGAAGRPLKGHLGHEPVIPAASRLVIAVVGIDAIGAPLTQAAVHRPERISELTGLLPGEPVTVGVVAKLLLQPEGYLRACPAASRMVVFINKVESPERCQQAEGLAALLLAAGHPQIDAVVIGSVLKQQFREVVAES
ncbi:MAG: selenium cofactor biosynthesis protein YqeC [Negativicutes bacterium]|nr:selenium cofactor biosynthesis protein YqeC [Negativicutes bacterium]